MRENPSLSEGMLPEALIGSPIAVIYSYSFVNDPGEARSQSAAIGAVPWGIATPARWSKTARDFGPVGTGCSDDIRPQRARPARRGPALIADIAEAQAAA